MVTEPPPHGKDSTPSPLAGGPANRAAAAWAAHVVEAATEKVCRQKFGEVAKIFLLFLADDQIERKGKDQIRDARDNKKRHSIWLQAKMKNVEKLVTVNQSKSYENGNQKLTKSEKLNNLENIDESDMNIEYTGKGKGFTFKLIIAILHVTFLKLLIKFELQGI
ncbi:hypothetical protein chiPu_0000969 [Chiloscyllium punctatum]|uniref:Uncharacterized protein n=1 Tax=Chiloscyllium punctatum TaxID=137246 RepID=A0A401RWS3_CHIPU|nr:hypothetical protein [Chiloscyllium punctatum]